MNRLRILFLSCPLLLTTVSFADDTAPQRVTVDNFPQAESDMYFDRFVKEGGFGKFKHERELASIDHQTVVRLNRDTMYSFGVFDLGAGPVTVTLPRSANGSCRCKLSTRINMRRTSSTPRGTFTVTKDDGGHAVRRPGEFAHSLIRASRTT